MESIDLNDPLVQIPFKDWPTVRDLYKTRWPHGVPGYYTLETQIQHPDLGTAYKVRLYCPFGNFEDGIVMFNHKGALEEVIILPIKENTEKLEESLVKTKRIDWNRENLLVPWAEEDVIEVMRKVQPRIGLKKVEADPTIKHFLSRDTKPYDLKCPPDTYMGPIKLENVTQVDSCWPNRYATSHKLFELVIKNDLSYGLFSKTDDALLAWVVLCEVGFLTHLYCEPEYRGKGYAEYVVQYVANDQLRQGKDVFCYISVDNVKSLNLFRKLNFDRIGRGVWLRFAKEN